MIVIFCLKAFLLFHLIAVKISKIFIIAQCSLYYMDFENYEETRTRTKKPAPAPDFQNPSATALRTRTFPAPALRGLRISHSA